MWGRAGRRGRGLAVYVAGEDALDQFFCRHPDEFLDRPVEAAILDHENEQIHAAHMLCAAHEGPLEPADAEYLGPELADDRRAARRRRRRCAERPGGTFVPRRPDEFPAAAVSLRSTGRDGFAIVDAGSGELLGTVDAARALTHDARGRGLPARRALVRGRRARPRRSGARSSQPFDGDWYTQPKQRDRHATSSALLDRREAHGRDALLRHRRRHRAGARLPDASGWPTTRRSTSSRSTSRRPRSPRRRCGTSCRRELLGRRLPARRRCSARCTPPSTRRSRCCRCWRCATAGTSAASRPTCTRRPAARRSSSTTATRAGSASRAAASSPSTRSSTTPTG